MSADFQEISQRGKSQLNSHESCGYPRICRYIFSRKAFFPLTKHHLSVDIDMVMSKEKGVTGVNKFFKSCSHCKTPWTLEQIVNDPQIKPIGISFGDHAFKECYYFFQHDTPNCGTSFVINVLTFAPLITEPIPSQILTGSATCERHCMRLEDLAACGQECRFAPFRRFLQKMISIKEQMSTAQSPQP